ncbi:MAG TPA: polymer-forming cytoskeletal protein [Xanthobacteraceae bacterium]|nr:polymer-forming cytoskeletal protein [Xanthobacteraceae bacterium]
MFGKTKDSTPDELRSPAPVQHFHSTAPAPAAAAESGNGVSSISAGMTVIGKIAGSGAVKVLGRVEGELHASTVLIADGAEVEGDVVAEELTVGGRVKGTIRANRVRLNSTAIVEGDIFHRSLAIEENARFEGTSRRDDNATDKPRAAAVRPQASAHALVGEAGRKLNGAPEKETQAAPAAG